eukprot:3809712-Pyramimonas_sp.AAC.1
MRCCVSEVSCAPPVPLCLLFRACLRICFFFPRFPLVFRGPAPRELAPLCDLPLAFVSAAVIVRLNE